MKLDALDRLVTKQDIKQFIEWHRVKTRLVNPSRDIVLGVAILCIVGWFTVTLLRVRGTEGQLIAATLLVCMLAGLAVIVPAYLIYNHRLRQKNAETGVRIERLAQDNGWRYVYWDWESKPTAMLFTSGHSHEYRHVVKSDQFEAGQMKFTVGHGRSETNYKFNYMVIKLKRKLPHMLLDGKANNTKAFGIDMTNLPISFKKNQIDMLEGDFNDHYTLYAPEGYNVDARYVFTPDLMHLLVEESEGIDIEIIDNYAVVYFSHSDNTQKAFWEKVGRLKSIFDDKLAMKSIRYEDERAWDGAVAERGQRLKRRVSVLAVVTGSLFILLEIMRLIMRMND